MESSLSMSSVYARLYRSQDSDHFELASVFKSEPKMRQFLCVRRRIGSLRSDIATSPLP
jgi:hypothetical protein